MSSLENKYENQKNCVELTETKMFQPRLKIDVEASKKFNSKYTAALREALFTHYEKPYQAAELPLSLQQKEDVNDTYFCRQCKDSFRHATSLEDHTSRGSWILGYWCTNCFNECEHLSGQKKYCNKCTKLQLQKHKALIARGLNEITEPGIVKIFFNPCQLLEHMKTHCTEEIDIHQLMLLPFPTGIGSEYFPHLRMISEALMDFMFLNNIHIVDWLNQNKIHKWWRMAKGENPVANIIKKYPFEVQQIKQLLNCNTRVNQDNRNDHDRGCKIKTENSKNHLVTPKHTFLSSNTLKQIPNNLMNISVTKLAKSTKPLSTKNKILHDEHTDDIILLDNRDSHPNTSTSEENFLAVNPVGSDISKGTIFVKKFAKIAECKSGKDTSFSRNVAAFFKNGGVNDLPKNVSGVPSKSLSSIKSYPNIAPKLKKKKIFLIRKSDRNCVESSNFGNKPIENSKNVRIIKFNRAELIKNNKIVRYQGLQPSKISLSQSLDKKNEITNPISNFQSCQDSKKDENFSHNDSLCSSAKLSDLKIVDCHSISRLDNAAENKEKLSEKKLNYSYATISTEKILEKFFNKQDLEFLTVIRNEKSGETFLSVSEEKKRIDYEDSMKFRKEMLSSLNRMDKNEIVLRIKHLEALSSVYSKKFQVSNDQVIEGHEKLILILENVTKSIGSPTESEGEFSSLLFDTSSTDTCITCQRTVRSPDYLIGFSELSDPNYCSCCDFICFKCDTFQGNKDRFDAHMKFHESNYPCTCPECKLDFLSAESLEIHMWTKCFHQFAKRFLCCTICEIGGFCSIETVINHFVTMHSLKMAVCSLCCMVFEHERYLISHLDKCHSEVESHTEPLLLILCQLDDKIMPVQRYKDHIMSHKCVQEVTFYDCNLCSNKSKRFETVESIKIHIDNNHVSELTNVMSRKPSNEMSAMESIRSSHVENELYNIVHKKSESEDSSTPRIATELKSHTSEYSNKLACNLMEEGETPKSLVQNDIRICSTTSADEVFEHESSKALKDVSTSNICKKNSDSTQFLELENKLLVSAESSTQNENIPETIEKDEKSLRHAPDTSFSTDERILPQACIKDSTTRFIQNEQDAAMEQGFLPSQENKTKEENTDTASKTDLKNTEEAESSSLQLKIKSQTLDIDAFASSDHQTSNVSGCSKHAIAVDSSSKSSECETLAKIVETESALADKEASDEYCHPVPTNCCLVAAENQMSALDRNTESSKEKTNTSNSIDDLNQNHTTNLGVSEDLELSHESPDTNNVDKISTHKINSEFEVLDDDCTAENNCINTNQNTELNACSETSNEERINRLQDSTQKANVLVHTVDTIEDSQEKKSSTVDDNINESNSENNQKVNNKDMYIRCDDDLNLKDSEFSSEKNVSQEENNKSISLALNTVQTENDQSTEAVSLDSCVTKCENRIISASDTEICSEHLRLSENNDHKNVSNLTTTAQYSNKHIGVDSTKVILHDDNSATNTANKCNEIEGESAEDSKIADDKVSGIIHHSVNNDAQEEFVVQPIDKKHDHFPADDKIKSPSSNVESTESLPSNRFLCTRNDADTPTEKLGKSEDLQTEYNEIDLKSNKTVNLQKEFYQNFCLSKNNEGSMYNDKKALQLKSSCDSRETTVQKIDLEELVESNATPKLLKSNTNSLEYEGNSELPPIELQNLPITDDEKINLSKASSHSVDSLELSNCEQSELLNDKQLRPRILNNLPSLEDRLTKKKRCIRPKFDAEVQSDSTLRQGNKSSEKKKVANRSGIIRNSLVRKNSKRCISDISKNDNAPIQNQNSNAQESSLPQMPQLKLIETSCGKLRNDNAFVTKNISRSTTLNKNKIGFSYKASDTIETCRFKCHLCGDMINTTRKVLDDHYRTKHTHDFEICTISLKLLRIPEDTINKMTHSRVSGKRSSTEALNTSSRKKKRWSSKKSTDKVTPISNRTTGLFVQLESAIDHEGNVKCKKCNKRCTNMVELRRHICENHRISKKNLLCLECGENFVVAPSLQMHLKAFHGINEPTVYMDKYPDYAPNILDYESEAEVTVANQCHVCMAVFEDKLAVDKHLRVHGMAFLNRKRIEARKSKCSPNKTQDNDDDSVNKGLKTTTDNRPQENSLLNK